LNALGAPPAPAGSGQTTMDGTTRADPPPPHLPRRVPLALILAVLAPAALLAGSGWNSWRAAQAAAEAEAIRATEVAAEYARRVLDGMVLRADFANELLQDVGDAEIRARESHFHRLLRGIPTRTGELGELHVFVHDREARSVVSGALFPVPPPERTFMHRDFNQALRDPGGPRVHVSQVHVGEATRRAFFAVSRRRERSGNGLPGGAYDGIIAVSVDVEAIAAALRRLTLRERDTVSLIRDDGQVLVRTSQAGPLPQTAVPPDSTLATTMRSGAELVVSHAASDIDGVRRIGVIRRVDGWPVYAAVARKQGAVIRSWQRAMLPQILLTLLCTALLATLALAVRRRERALVEANASLEGRVAARTASLAASEAEFRATFEGSPVGKTQSDPATGRYLRVNPAFCALTGYTEAELLGMTVADLTHPEDREADLALRRTLALHGTRFRLEKRYLRKDGATIWVEVAVGLIRAPDTGLPLRTIATVQDITERRRAEERLLLLTREVDHRAKNALAVVQAAIRLAPKTDPAAFVRAVEGRVAALSRAQVMLAEASWRGADLRTLAEGALGTFLAVTDADAPRAEVAGPPVLLAATAAQPLSLALHELATNAARYGALSAPGGLITLTWEIDRQAGALRLAWAEAGGPPIAAPPSHRGFGTRVVDATIREQLGGTVARSWNTTGLTCDITLPLRNLLQVD